MRRGIVVILAVAAGLMLAQRLLMASGGTGGFDVPAATVTLTTAPDGAWTHVNEPKAVEHNGIIYFGYVDMGNGNLEVRSWNPDTGVVSSPFVISAALEVDNHAAPTLYVRSDGRLLVVYCEHNATTMYRRVSTNPLPDISAFGSEGTVVTGTDLTYPTLVPYGSDIHLYYRDYVSTTARLMQLVTDDDGDTWGSASYIFGSATRQSYWMVASNGSRIDYVTSDGRNPPDDDPVPIYHWYYDGTWRNSAGTSIGSPTFDPTDFTEVYDAADGMGWPVTITQRAGSPVFGYAVLDSASTNSWRRAHYSGGWINETIASSAGVIEGGFAGNFALDLDNPDRAWVPVQVGSYFEMHRATRSSGGVWSTGAITEASGVDNISPAPIYGGTTYRVLWLRGTYTTYLDQSLAVVAGR